VQQQGTPLDPIYKNNTIVIVKSEDTPASNTLMIAVICAIIGVIIFGGAAGYFLYRRYTRQSLKTLDASSRPVEQSSKAESMHGGSPDCLADDVYQEQYHPKAEFDIFGKGDPFAKGNMADDVEEEDNNNGSPGPYNEYDVENQLRTVQEVSKMQESTPLGTI
jgi:hypothetical protein